MPHPIQPGGSGGGGGGAPANAQYLVLAPDGTLTQERVFNPSSNFLVVDGGAGGNYDIDLSSTTVAPGSYTYASITVDTKGRLTAAASGAAPVASGWTYGGTTVYLSTSTDVVSIGNNAGVTKRKLSVYNTGTNLGASVVTLASTDNVIETFVSGEANLRWSVDGTGATKWGAGGGSALDTRLYRSAANTLALDNGAAGAATFAPGGDNVSSIGTTSLRWNTTISTNFYVYSAAGVANPTTALQGQSLRFGAGGASALDLRLFRSGVSTLGIDANGGGGATIVPASDGSGSFGTNNLRWLDFIANTFRAFPSVGAVNASTSLGSGFLKMGAGGATALDTAITRTAASTLTIDNNAGGSAVVIMKGTANTQQRIHGALSKAVADSPYTTAATDEMIFWNCVGGNCTQNLPTPVGALGRTLIVKRTDTSANTLTLTPAAGQIEGGASYVVPGGANRASVTLMSDGSNWWVI